MATSLGIGGQIVTDGLVLCLDAANKDSYPGSGTTWYDLSGNGYNSTAAGTVGPTFNSNGYFEFTGGIVTENYSRFDTPTIPAQTDITVEVFYNPSSGWETVFRQAADDFHIRSGRVAAGNAYNDFNISPTAAEQHNGLGNWTYNALTWDNGLNLKLFKDGVLTKSGTRASVDSDGIAASAIKIGTRNDAYAEHFVGSIALFRLYSRALTATEILNNYNATKSRLGL